MVTRLPFAVYGTLRSGHRNSTIWQNVGVSDGLAFVYGYDLYALGGFGFPFAAPSGPPDNRIVVELLRPRLDCLYDEMLYRFASLESEGSLYRRVKVLASHTPHDTGTGDVAWMYVGLNEALWDGAWHLPSGDWTDQSEARLIGLNPA